MTVVVPPATEERRLRERAGVSATSVEEVVVRRGVHLRRIVSRRDTTSGATQLPRPCHAARGDRRNIARGTPMRIIRALAAGSGVGWLATGLREPHRLDPTLTARALLAVGAVIARILRRQWILHCQGAPRWRG